MDKRPRTYALLCAGNIIPIPKGGRVYEISIAPKDTIEPGTGIPGYPETQRIVHASYVERQFQIDYVDIDPECVNDGFVIDNIYIGNNCVWDCAPGSVTAKILASRPEIKWPIANAGQEIVLLVSKVSGEPRPFKARLVGHEFI